MDILNDNYQNMLELEKQQLTEHFNKYNDVLNFIAKKDII